MSDEHIVRRTLATRRRGRTDWTRIDAMTEAEIEENAASDPDALPVPDEELARAGTVLFLEEENGPAHAVPLDPDVAGYFQPLGARQREQINRILRDYIAARRAAG